MFMLPFVFTLFCVVREEFVNLSNLIGGYIALFLKLGFLGKGEWILESRVLLEIDIGVSN